MARKEKEELLKKDYRFASRLQKELNETNAHNIRVPPIPPKHLPLPPPPPDLPLTQLPIMPTKNQLLMSQLSTIGRYRKLKPVNTIEKRGFRLGLLFIVVVISTSFQIV